ncbi:MAG TPA: methyltransferase domain-containing protein, partial [Dehalococcoidales bacterium]|nr:methyltransferase domain-containing protein [Dehalococcoidales bacterium]
GMTVLDVGSGTGVFLPYIFDMVGPGGSIIALDYAEKMLRESKNKPHPAGVCYLCGDALHLPLADNSCDAVVCYSSFPHFPDKKRAIAELMRVINDGGQIFVCHTSGREQINAIHGKVPVLQNHLLPDAIEMEQLLRQAGFVEIAVRETPESYFAVGRKAKVSVPG